MSGLLRGVNPDGANYITVQAEGVEIVHFVGGGGRAAQGSAHRESSMSQNDRLLSLG